VEERESALGNFFGGVVGFVSKKRKRKRSERANRYGRQNRKKEEGDPRC
jgi:hypothetical protein